MRKMVIGKGHLGQYMKEVWGIPQELHWTRNIAEITDEEIQKLHPDIIINAAGKTDLPWCENNAYETIQSNIVAPVKLYALCVKHKITFVHLSSGCVWDGPYNQNEKPFTPADPVTPACMYTWTKSACDALLLQNNPNYVIIIRPRQIYSPIKSQRNTLDKLIKYPKLLNTDNSMTSADTILKTIDKIISTNTRGLIMNVYDKGISSPYQVAVLLAEAGLRQKPEILSKSDLDQWHKPKRVDTVLYDAFFEDLVNPPTVNDELRRVISLYAGD